MAGSRTGNDAMSIVRVIAWHKCEKCDKSFGETKTGIAWKLRRANHNTRVHGANIETELEKI
jgi:hypothetical protein